VFTEGIPFRFYRDAGPERRIFRRARGWSSRARRAAGLSPSPARSW